MNSIQDNDHVIQRKDHINETARYIPTMTLKWINITNRSKEEKKSIQEIDKR